MVTNKQIGLFHSSSDFFEQSLLYIVYSDLTSDEIDASLIEF